MAETAPEVGRLGWFMITQRQCEYIQSNSVSLDLRPSSVVCDEKIEHIEIFSMFVL